MKAFATAGWLAGQAWRRDWLVGMGLFVLAFLVYAPVLGQYWTADDPPILASIATHGIWAHFTSPAVWAWHQPEPPMWGVFTPWVMLSMGLDWHLGGLDPFAGYFHHLISLGLTMALLYVVLRRFFSRPAACLVCLLYLLSQPVQEAVHYLMERHYIEGLGLFLACMLSYERAVQAQTARPANLYGCWFWAAASGLLYLAACTAKEIYAPLAALLPLLPWGTWRRRWVMLLPHALAALLYMAWRAYILSPDYLFSYMGGKIQLGLQWWLHLLDLGLVFNFLYVSWHRWIMVALGVFLLGALLHASKMAWLRALVMLVVVMLPLYPLLKLPQMRLYFLPVLVLLIGYAFITDWLLWLSQSYTLRKREGALAISNHWLVSGLVLALMVAPFLPGIFYPFVSTRGPFFAQFKREGEFVMQSSSTKALVHPTSWPMGFWWYFTALSRLRHDVLHDDQSPAVCYDPCVCSALMPRQSMRSMAGQLHATLWPVSRDPGVCGDRTSPLQVHLSLEQGKDYPLLKWRLGPYGEDGYYELILEEKDSNMHGRPESVRPIGLHPVGHGHFVVTVRWNSAAGWSTVSPPFEIVPGMPAIDWSRPWQPHPAQQARVIAPTLPDHVSAQDPLNSTTIPTTNQGNKS